MTDVEITECCAQAGLRLRGVERRGGVLLLLPDGLAALPSPEELRALAAQLQARSGVRWVSLDIAGPA